MAKRDDAFELFNQGVKPGDILLADLGLKFSTEKKYYASWKKPQPVAEAEPKVEAKAEIEVEAKAEIEVAPLPDPNAPVIDSAGNVIRERLEVESKPEPEPEPEVETLAEAEGAEEAPAEVPVAVSVPIATLVANLGVGAEFELEGISYRVNRIDEEAQQVQVMLLEWAPSGDVKVERYPVNMPLDTLVTPQ